MRRLRVNEWCCAIRFVSSDKDLLFNGNTKDEFFVLKNSLRYWCADPFLYEKGGKYYLFFEMFDRIKRKGLLGYREVYKNGCGKMHVIYESSMHLSYPFLLKKDGGLYIIPESGSGNELFVLKCVSFPDKWVKVKTLLREHVVDTTRLEKDGKVYYITQKVVEKGVFDRVDIYYEENGELAPARNNPLKIDINTARCAGAIINSGGQYIRPSQDCGKYYGEKLNFNMINEISPNSYNESLISVCSVKDIKLNQKNDFIGIHTYNHINGVETIDLKTPAHFSILNIIGAILKRLVG